MPDVSTVFTPDHRFEELTAFLAHYRPLWQPRPFVAQPIPLQTTHPDIAAWLLGWDEVTIEQFESNVAAAPGAPPSLVALAAEVDRFALAPTVTSVPPLPVQAEQGVPLRKRAQIRAFGDQLAARRRGTSILDWCAGKGHLGRWIGEQAGVRVRAVDRRPELARQAEDLAKRRGVDLVARAADVLTDPPLDWIDRDTTVVGLHACGVLTDAALAAAVDGDAAAVGVAPCCFHAQPEEPREPRSAQGRAAGLAMVRQELRLPSSEEIVLTPRLRRLRRREMVFRIALDRLCRDQLGFQTYQPRPTVPRSWLQLDFAGFVAQVAARDQLDVVVPRAVEPLLERAERWVRRARSLGSVRVLFRRPLELWLALDRAAWLAEQGWEAEVTAFCPRTVTPRNLLVSGRPG